MIPDDVYIRKAAEGDDTAFDVLVKRHRPKIYEVAHRMLGNQRDAERITHASFLAARKHIRAFQGRTAFGTWLYWYFAQRAVIIIALAWVIGIVLVSISAFREAADAEEVVVERIEQTAIQLLALVVGMEVNELIERLKVDGYVVERPEMSVEQLAEKYNADTEEILLSVFGEE